METEKFISGYCRCQDGPRTVALVLEDGVLTEWDCQFPDCIYASACPIAKELGEYTL